MAAMVSGPRRISDMLFRRDMVGPSFGSIVASMTGLLLVEKLILEVVLPSWAPLMESVVLQRGLFFSLNAGGFLLMTVAFWGVGSLLALPALLGAVRWKIQPRKSLELAQLRASLPLICLNFAFGTAMAPPIFYYLLPKESFDLRRTPSTMTLARDVVVWMAVEEVLFFYLHRWMHENKQMYARVHKIHHQWTAPISFVAIYCHPFEHVLCNLTPFLVGPLLCGSHIVAVGTFIFLGLVHTLAVHSGYWIVDDDGMHDEHHAKFNVNYGVIGVLDMWHGTYRLPAGSAGAGMDEVSSSKRD